jgi:Tfp pilus assembly protein PilF
MTVANFRRAIAALVVFAGAQHVLPLVTTHLTAVAQSTSGTKSSANGQSRKETIHNPLNDYLDEAQRDIDKNDFTAAITPLQKFIAEKPEVAFAHFQLAYAYTALKQVPEARAEYERAISLDPKMTEAYLNLGILLSDPAPADAVAPLKKAVELLPSQSRPRILLGVAQERAGDFSGAANSFEGAVNLDPRDTEATLHLARLYLKLKRPADAESKFRTLVNADPNSTVATLGLAQTLDAEGKPEAADAYRKYLVLQPNDQTVRARVIHSLVEQQNYDEALAELDRADKDNPPSSDTLRLRADIQIAQKHFDDAIATLQRAIALTPKDAQLVAGLGRIYLQKHDYESAKKQFKAAIQLEPNNVTYWKDMNSAYYLSGDCVSTLAGLDVIAKVEQPGAGSWFIRALCYDKLHQIKPALEAYQKFLSMDENKNPDQVWQAKQRTQVLQHQLEAKRQ